MLLRLLITATALVFVLTACGNRTPLQLPKPAAKPNAQSPAPAQGEGR